MSTKQQQQKLAISHLLQETETIHKCVLDTKNNFSLIEFVLS